MRWDEDGIGSWQLLAGHQGGRRPRPRRGSGSRPKSPSAIWQPERGGRCRSRTMDVRKRRLMSPAELHLLNLGTYNMGRRVVRVLATHFSQGLSHNVGMRPYEIAAAVANLWPIAQYQSTTRTACSKGVLVLHPFDRVRQIRTCAHNRRLMHGTARPSAHSAWIVFGLRAERCLVERLVPRQVNHRAPLHCSRE